MGAIVGLSIGIFLADAVTYLFHYALDIGGATTSFLLYGPMRAVAETFNRVHCPDMCVLSGSSEQAWGGQARLSILGGVIALLALLFGLPVVRVAVLAIAFISNFVF